MNPSELAALYEAGTLDRKTLADALQENDRDGLISDEVRAAEGVEPMPMGELLEILARELWATGATITPRVAADARNLPET